MSVIVSKNIFWLSFSRVLALVLLFVAYARLLRYMGPENFGQYQFVLSFVLLFSTVVDFGIQQFITKKISENPGDSKKYFHSFLAFESVVAAVLYGLLLCIAWQGHYPAHVFAAIAIVGLGMVANALTYPFLAVLTAAQDLKKVAIINFLNSIVNVVFIFAAIYFGKSIVFLASIQLVFGILDLILYRIFLQKHIEKPDILSVFQNFDLSIIKSIFVSAWPFVILVGFSAVYNRIDMIIVTRMLGFEQAGLYGAAYKIFDLLGFFPAVVSHTLFPHFSALMAQSKLLEVRENLEKYLRFMLAAALPMAVGGTLLSKGIIMLLAGPEFISAAPVLSIIIWAPAILFIYIPVNSLVISQLTKKAAGVTGANVVVNIAGNLLLVPLYGIKAAACMTVFSEFVQGFFYFYHVRKNITPFSFWALLWKPAVASLAMALSLWPWRDASLAVTLPFGAVVYAVVLLVTGFLHKDDIAFAKSFFSNK